MFTLFSRERLSSPGRYRCDAERGRCSKAAAWKWKVGPIEVAYCSWHDMGERIAQQLTKNEVITVGPERNP